MAAASVNRSTAATKHETISSVDSTSAGQSEGVCSNDSENARSWGADCGVGATSLWIAYIRHHERFQEKPAFVDPFAERFLQDGKGEEVTASMARSLYHFMYMNDAGTDFHQSLTRRYFDIRSGKRYVKRMRDQPVPVDTLKKCNDPLANGVRLRTAYFDERIESYFQDCQGPRQFVTLASGADCRCLRLENLQQDGVRTWLIDQPAVISTFRSKLPELESRTDIQTLGVKFGEELWWEQLVASGFDLNVPTLFLVEGLVMYLKEAEIMEIFHEIYKLMAPGSVIMGDYVNKGFLHHPMVAPFQEQLQSYQAPWTYGALNSASWANMLSGCGIEVREDLPSVEMHSVMTKAKFFFIDNLVTYIPTYRTYVAVKASGEQKTYLGCLGTSCK